jgi:hypothetical protein
MGFRKGIYYPHPPRGPARQPYTVSEAARRQRVRNLQGTRTRSDRESLVIKLLIWQSSLGISQRTLARQLGVWPSYICKVQKQPAITGALADGHRVTLGDLNAARGFTARLRDTEPGLLAALRHSDTTEPRVMTVNENIAETQREVAEWKRKNLRPHEMRRRIRVPIPM